MTEIPPPLSAVPPADADGNGMEERIEQVPAEVRTAARKAFAERGDRAEILDLLYDSLLDETAGDVHGA